MKGIDTHFEYNPLLSHIKGFSLLIKSKPLLKFKQYHIRFLIEIINSKAFF